MITHIYIYIAQNMKGSKFIITCKKGWHNVFPKFFFLVVFRPLNTISSSSSRKETTVLIFLIGRNHRINTNNKTSNMNTHPKIPSTSLAKYPRTVNAQEVSAWIEDISY